MRILLALLLLGAVAHADPDPPPADASPSAAPSPSDDGYCDFVEGVANSTSYVQLAPSVFSDFGYIPESPITTNPTAQQTTLRLIAGVNYRLTGIYEGLATRDHAVADCRRHQALAQVRGQTEARALAARVKVLDDALPQAEKILRDTTDDMEARRTTAQEATATRLRVEELRGLDADAHSQLAALPPPGSAPLSTALATYQAADAQMEHDDAKLRTAQGVDVSVKLGLDDFLDAPAGTTPASPFALLSVSLNLGTFLQGGQNARAASGRRRLLASGHEPLEVDATIEKIRATIEIETRRAQDTDALVADLQRQMDQLGRIGGDDSKRYRETVWFDYVKAKADQAYLAAHIASLREVLGGGS